MKHNQTMEALSREVARISRIKLKLEEALMFADAQVFGRSVDEARGRCEQMRQGLEEAHAAFGEGDPAVAPFRQKQALERLQALQ